MSRPSGLADEPSDELIALLTKQAREIERCRERIADCAGRFPERSDDQASQYEVGWKDAIHYVIHGELRPDDPDGEGS